VRGRAGDGGRDIDKKREMAGEREIKRGRWRERER
jgi:hypothetical protein